jgi:hypothetical protein
MFVWSLNSFVLHADAMVCVVARCGRSVAARPEGGPPASKLAMQHLWCCQSPCISISATRCCDMHVILRGRGQGRGCIMVLRVIRFIAMIVHDTMASCMACRHSPAASFSSDAPNGHIRVSQCVFSAPLRSTNLCVHAGLSAQLTADFPSNHGPVPFVNAAFH